MNMNTVINMVMRRVMSVLINKGINAGVDKLSSRNPNPTQSTADQQRQSQETAKKLRQGARLTRRIGRF